MRAESLELWSDLVAMFLLYGGSHTKSEVPFAYHYYFWHCTMGISYQSLSHINANIWMSSKTLKNFNIFLQSNQVVVLGGENTHFWYKMGRAHEFCHQPRIVQVQPIDLLVTWV